MSKVFGFDLSFHRLVDDAANLCRWNPSEAMRWFDAARARAIYPIDIMAYNRAVLRARYTLTSIEKSRYYNQEYHNNFWGEGVVPSRPQLLEVNLTEDERLSLVQA